MSGAGRGAQPLLRLAAHAGGGGPRTNLRNGNARRVRPPLTLLRNPTPPNRVAGKRPPNGALGLAYGPAPAWAADAPAQSLRPAHDRFDPRPAVRAEPIARSAPPDPKPTGYGLVKLLICPKLMATGPTCAPFRMGAPRTWWAGRYGLTCQRRWLQAPCSGRCWPKGPPQP